MTELKSIEPDLKLLIRDLEVNKAHCPDDQVLDRMIDQAIKLTKEYQYDPINYKLALEICLAFQNHIERLEKQRRQNNESRSKG